MKVITEISLREQFKGGFPKEYYLPEGTLLSPSAREYLAHKKVKIVREEPKKEEVVEESKVPKAKYKGYETDAVYFEKPENMTQLIGDQLVYKDHPRIILRGKMDSLQSLVVMIQVEIYEKTKNQKIVEVLEEVLVAIRDVVRAEVLEEQLQPLCLMNLMEHEIRERSHHPEKYFNIKQMTLPHYKMGYVYARLNQLRSTIREVESYAVIALDTKRQPWALAIIQRLNRLSSIMHVLMCMELADGGKGRASYGL